MMRRHFALLVLAIVGLVAAGCQSSSGISEQPEEDPMRSVEKALVGEWSFVTAQWPQGDPGNYMVFYEDGSILLVFDEDSAMGDWSLSSRYDTPLVTIHVEDEDASEQLRWFIRPKGDDTLEQWSYETWWYEAGVDPRTFLDAPPGVLKRVD